MITEDQSGVITFLSDPASHSGHSVERMETHISEVFLAGDRVYKLKRAVKLPYLDFSTAQLREEVCKKEYLLNQAASPSIYLGIRRITQEPDGKLCFDGSGEMVDAVVEMRRFSQNLLFDHIAADGKLTVEQVDQLAQIIEEFHQSAPISSCSGGYDNIAKVLAVNAAGFAISNLYGDKELLELEHSFNNHLETYRDLLDKRQIYGKIRRCHGDLHLRNIVLIDKKPTMFDCLEFSDDLATIDILYDLAFLIMDLWHRNLKTLANRMLNRYLDHSFDDEGFVLASFFMAIRAAVRAHVIATQTEDAGDDREALTELSQSYFQLARQSLKKHQPAIIAIGGLSGTGKTTIAEALAPMIVPPPGARIVESDRIRKSMFGKYPEDRLDPEAYTIEISEDVYGEMRNRTTKIASAGGTVIADAVFLDVERRNAIEDAAHRASVPFYGIWLEAGSDALFERIKTRQASPSDATSSVLEQQLQREPGEIKWHRVDTSNSLERVTSAILATLDKPSS